MIEATGGAQQELPREWRDFLGPESDALLAPIMAELAKESEYYPKNKIFRAFELCPPSSVAVCIFGQDPYHGEGQANGLAFAVAPGQAIPPSLRNIYKELRSDLGWERAPDSGDLSAWAASGALLLNAMLSVRPGEAGSHAGLGWQAWTDLVLRRISEQSPSTVFVLWGGFAKKKAKFLAPGALVVEGGHPSPLSANRGGFFGGGYFSKANALRCEKGEEPFNWMAILGKAEPAAEALGTGLDRPEQ